MHVFLLKAGDRSAICYTVNQQRFSKFLTCTEPENLTQKKNKTVGIFFYLKVNSRRIISVAFKIC